MTAIGRQVAIGRSQAAEARLIVTRNEAASTSVGWRASSVAWSFKEIADADWGGNYIRVRALTDQLWFLMATANGSSIFGDVAARTKDGGTTWDTTYAPPASPAPDDPRGWLDFAITTDGTLWGLTVQEDGQHTEIWKSIDDGDNWDLEYAADVAVYRLRFLVAHPTDPRRIAAYGTHEPAGGHRHPIIIFSINGGDDWSVNAHSSVFPAGPFVRSQDIIQLTSNRFVMFNTRLVNTNAAFWTSDDNGATWVTRTIFSTPSSGTTRFHSIVGEPSGVGLYSYFRDVVGPPHRDIILASYDGGATWADLGNDIPVINSGSASAGITYDPVEKALYTFGTGTGRTDLGDHIWKLFPIHASGTWKEVAGQILPFDGDASYSSAGGSHGIAVIPRP